MKRGITIVLAIVLTLTFITGCNQTAGTQPNESVSASAKSESKTETISLTIMGGAHLTSISEAVLNDYMAAHPELEISFEKYSYAEYPTKQRIQLSTGEGVPDILIAHHEFAIQYVAADWVMDISDLVEADNLLPVLDVVMKDGAYYGLPDNCTTMYAFIYREDIYNDLGLTPPHNFEEYYQQGLTLKEKGYYIGAYDPSASQNSDLFYMYLQLLGGRVFDEKGNAVLEKGEEALEMLKRAYDAGILHKSVSGISSDYWAAFNEGEIAAVPQGIGMAAYYETNLDPDGKGGFGKLRLEPGFCMIEGGPESVTFYPDFFLINKNTKYPQQCKDLISYLAQSEEASIKYANVNEEGLMVRYGNGYIPGLEKIASGEGQMGWDAYGGQKVLSDVCRAMIDLQLRPNPVSDKSAESVSIMDEVLGDFFLNAKYDIAGAISVMRDRINGI